MKNSFPVILANIWNWVFCSNQGWRHWVRRVRHGVPWLSKIVNKICNKKQILRLKGLIFGGFWILTYPDFLGSCRPWFQLPFWGFGITDSISKIEIHRLKFQIHIENWIVRNFETHLIISRNSYWILSISERVFETIFCNTFSGFCVTVLIER